MKAQWDELPAEVHDAVEATWGPVLKAETFSGGLMPGVACRLHIETGVSVFFKAVSLSSPAASLYARERWANSVLPDTVPSPRMRWSNTTADWLLMVFDYVDGQSVDLSPGSPDIPAVLATVAQLNEVLTPCPAVHAPDVAHNVAALQEKAQALLARPADLPDCALYRTALDAFDLDTLTGDTLLHYDLHPGNLCMTSGEALHVLDWSFAAAGAAWIDAVMLTPRFIEAGHTPEQAEALVSKLPVWATAPPAALTGLAALWTLFRAYKARFGPERVRVDRARAAAAGSAWVRYRMG